MIEGDELILFGQSLRHATERHSGAALDAALRQLGWQDALSVDARAAVSLLFEWQGTANATSSALDQVLAAALGHQAMAVVLPALGQWCAPGTLDSGRLDVRGVATASLRDSETALVVARTGGSHLAVEVETASLVQRTVGGLDPSLSLIEVGGQVDGARQLGPVDWAAAVALGQLALGHELVGASRRMLALAREHALVRIQFGRPIAMFQAVRHRLAETLVAIEAAAALLDEAWQDHAPQPMQLAEIGSSQRSQPIQPAEIGPSQRFQTAGMAKAVAGRGARVAARHCQQVLAGIGFTLEHPLHRHVRRILVLEQLLGSTRDLTRALGGEIIEHRHLPAPLPL